MKLLIFSCFCAVFSIAACGRAQSTGQSANTVFMEKSVEQKAVEGATMQFLGGADKSDVAVLDAVLHPQYRLVLNRVFGDAVTTMDKPSYLQMITDKKIGGVPRQSKIISVVVVENVAAVEVTTTNDKADIHIFLHFIKEPDGKWLIVSDTPFAKFKK